MYDVAYALFYTKRQKKLLKLIIFKWQECSWIHLNLGHMNFSLKVIIHEPRILGKRAAKARNIA